MAYNTGNPIGSSSPKDLKDNAQNLDWLILGPALSYPDRRGVNRLSWSGIEASFSAAQAQRRAEHDAAQSRREFEFETGQFRRDKEFDAAQLERTGRFDLFIASSSYDVIGDYASQPVTFTERNQLMLKDGELWKPKASVALPYVTNGVWATESVNFASAGDAALRQDLAGDGGSALQGFRDIPGKIYQTAQEKMGQIINVLDFLTEAQRENARLRLGTLDCGPGIQAAINAAGNGQLTWPGGYLFGTGQELIVRYAQKWAGGGKGKLLTPFGEENVANCQIISCGDGTAYKTVKTRQLYRGSAADPQDAPISAILSVQHQGFDMGDISVKCWYDPERIKTDPKYLGHDWDVGVFVGCRLHCKIRDTAVVGCFRVASVYHDVTRGLGLPELFGWDGIQHPVDSKNGGDGARISELITWGGKWGVQVQGGDPKPGLVSYGKDYKVSLTATFSTLPAINDTITLGERVFTFVSDPDVAGQVGIGATTAECVSLLIDAAIDIYSGDTVAPKFRSGLYLQQGDALLCVARDSTATNFKDIFVASVSAPARIVLSSRTPQSIPDPAPYYDEQLGAAIPDYRGSYGFSDFTMKDSQLFGSEHPTRTARDAIRPDKNWLIDTGGGAYSISGLAGNSSRMLQGHRYFNVRFDNSFDPFSVRLGRTHRDEFFGVQFDGNRTNYSNPDGSKVGNNLRNYKYGPVTRIPNITRRTRFYSLDTSLWAEYCNLTDSGSGKILSGTGGNLLTSTLTVTRGSLVVDRSESANGVGTIAIYGGSSGQSVLRFKKGGDATTQASLRYDPVAAKFTLASTGIFGVQVPSFNMQSSAPVRSYVSSGGELTVSGNPETVGATIFRVRSGNDTRLRLSDTELVPYVSVRPNAGNTHTCGAAGLAWSDMYSQNAVTVTSDANKKTPVQPLQAQELLAGSRLLREIGIYQWLESIDEKGVDLARYHVGMTVQRAMEILTDCGLEATRYGFICFDEWQDEFDTVAAVTESVPAEDDSDSYTLREVSPEKRILVRAAGSTFGFREGPLHGLMLRAMAAEFDQLKADVAALKAAQL